MAFFIEYMLIGNLFNIKYTDYVIDKINSWFKDNNHDNRNGLQKTISDIADIYFMSVRDFYNERDFAIWFISQNFKGFQLFYRDDSADSVKEITTDTLKE